MSSVVSVIPARGGSVGVPGKNMREVGGLPLVVRSFRHARHMGVPVLLSTDSSQIADLIGRFSNWKAGALQDTAAGSVREVAPGQFLHHRPASLASSTARIGDALRQIRESLAVEEVRFDAWILLQPTTPFRRHDELNTIVELAGATPVDGSLVSVRRAIDEHPARMYIGVGETRMKSLGLFSGKEADNRQSLPPVFLRDGGFYVIGDALVSQGRQFTNTPLPFERVMPWSINIDSELDLRLAKLVGTELEERIS